MGQYPAVWINGIFVRGVLMLTLGNAEAVGIDSELGSGT